jgi:hypothetical protein
MLYLIINHTAKAAARCAKLDQRRRAGMKAVPF